MQRFVERQYKGEIDMSPEEKEQKKIENICEMFPHVECNLVKDFFYDCGRNINETMAQLSALFPSEEPKWLEEETKEVQKQAPIEQPKIDIMPI